MNCCDYRCDGVCALPVDDEEEEDVGMIVDEIEDNDEDGNNDADYC